MNIKKLTLLSFAFWGLLIASCSDSGSNNASFENESSSSNNSSSSNEDNNSSLGSEDWLEASFQDIYSIENLEETDGGGTFTLTELDGDCRDDNGEFYIRANDDKVSYTLKDGELYIDYWDYYGLHYIFKGKSKNIIGDWEGKRIMDPDDYEDENENENEDYDSYDTMYSKETIVLNITNDSIKETKAIKMCWAKASQWEFENYPEDYPEGLNVKANGCNEMMYTLNNETVKINLISRDNLEDKNYSTATFNDKKCENVSYTTFRRTAARCEEAYNAYKENGDGGYFYFEKWLRYTSEKAFKECLEEIEVPEELKELLL